MSTNRCEHCKADLTEQCLHRSLEMAKRGIQVCHACGTEQPFKDASPEEHLDFARRKEIKLGRLYRV